MKKNINLLIAFLIYCNFSMAQSTNLVKNIGKGSDSIIAFVSNLDSTGMILQSTLSGPGDRVVYWVHGLGGNQSSWIMAATASQQGIIRNGQVIFPARKIESIIDIKYDESISNFDMAVQSLQEIIHSKKLNLTQSERQSHFLIAHSQGGLVCRYLDKQLNTTNPGNFYRDFGGIVTFATPHAGAAIINTVQSNNNKVARFFSDACSDLTEGPLDEEIGNSFWVEIFGLRKKANEFKGLFCDNIGMFSNSLAKIYTGSLGLAYQTNSPTIADLKLYNTPTPKVCFYGVAPTDGIASSILYSYGVSGANKYDNFEASKSTEEGKKEVNTLMNTYKIKAFTLHHYWDCFWISGFLYIGYECSNRKMRYEYYDEYMKGVNFIKNMDDRWLDLIGARYTTQETITEVYCAEPDRPVKNDPTSSKVSLNHKYLIGNTEGNSEAPTNPCADYPGTIPVYTTRVITNVFYKESDGIVLAESASAFPGTINTKNNIKLSGSNHEQIKNDKNTKLALTKLYNGLSGSYFQTDLR